MAFKDSLIYLSLLYIEILIFQNPTLFESIKHQKDGKGRGSTS